jgi:hypothetical protein
MRNIIWGTTVGNCAFVNVTKHESLVNLSDGNSTADVEDL